MQAAPSLSYSTGPSGVYLEKLFKHWEILEEIRPRIVVPPPGVPVGALVAEGRVALGFQQLVGTDEPAGHRGAGAIARCHPDGDGFLRWHLRRQHRTGWQHARCSTTWHHPQRPQRNSAMAWSPPPDKVRAGSWPGNRRKVPQGMEGRKVRAPVDKVPGNAWGARAHGKCNREETAEAPPSARWGWQG